MAKTQTNTQIVNTRGADGKWLPGCPSPNPKGGPLLGKNRLDLLLTAVRKVESEKNKLLLVHFVEEAYKDNGVLIALIRKLHPDLSAVALSNIIDETELNEHSDLLKQHLLAQAALLDILTPEQKIKYQTIRRDLNETKPKKERETK